MLGWEVKFEVRKAVLRSEGTERRERIVGPEVLREVCLVVREGEVKVF